MTSADPIQMWHDLYVMLGASSATLIGLIFVAASLHFRDLVSNPAVRVRAYHGTLYLLILLVEAVLILTPQPVTVLGAQLCALNLAGLWLPLSWAYRYYCKAVIPAGVSMTRIMSNSVAYLLGICGGIALFASSHWGMYLITASFMTLLVSVVLGAWQVALGIGQTEEKEKGR